MAGEQDNPQAFRQIEEQILDLHYKHYPFILRNDEDAIPGLLRAFGDLVRRSFYDQSLQTERHKQNFIDKAATLGHCFHWLDLEPEHPLILPDNSPRIIEKEALDLLDWGVRYHELVLNHVAVTRGEKVANLDAATRTIEFRYKDQCDPFFLLTQRADELQLAKSYYESMPLKELQAEFRRWLDQHRTALLRRSDGLPSIRPGDPAYQLAAQWATEQIWPELGPETSLDGFSLGDFRAIYAGLIVNCAFLAWTEEIEDSTRGISRMRPSVVIGLSQQRMVEWLADISGVEADASREILKEITLDTRRRLPSMAYQPFIRSKAERIYLLPRLILYSDAPRTLSQSLNTGSRRRAFERLDKPMADAQQRVIGSVLTRLGLNVLSEQLLRPLAHRGLQEHDQSCGTRANHLEYE